MRPTPGSPRRDNPSGGDVRQVGQQQLGGVVDDVLARLEAGAARHGQSGQRLGVVRSCLATWISPKNFRSRVMDGFSGG
ncbi:hypothetical protein GCM10020221_27240 [Streptomyces thioluteus]|uniref:Uncharacterized protein n=1 Tax=Streptomyces thioluteus TaxID=66431 RepID=A0ABN3WYX0_STRTU